MGFLEGKFLRVKNVRFVLLVAQKPGENLLGSQELISAEDSPVHKSELKKSLDTNDDIDEGQQKQAVDVPGFLDVSQTDPEHIIRQEDRQQRSLNNFPDLVD